MTDILETPKKRMGRPLGTRRNSTEPGSFMTAVEQVRAEASATDDEPLPQRYPAEGLGASPSLDALRFYELYHAGQSMRAQVAAFWHGKQLRVVHERLRGMGEEPEHEVE